MTIRRPHPCPLRASRSLSCPSPPCRGHQPESPQKDLSSAFTSVARPRQIALSSVDSGPNLRECSVGFRGGSTGGARVRPEVRREGRFGISPRSVRLGWDLDAKRCHPRRCRWGGRLSSMLGGGRLCAGPEPGCGTRSPGPALSVVLIQPRAPLVFTEVCVLLGRRPGAQFRELLCVSL